MSKRLLPHSWIGYILLVPRSWQLLVALGSSWQLLSVSNFLLYHQDGLGTDP